MKTTIKAINRDKLYKLEDMRLEAKRQLSERIANYQELVKPYLKLRIQMAQLSLEINDRQVFIRNTTRAIIALRHPDNKI